MKAIHDLADTHRAYGHSQRMRDFSAAAWALAKAGDGGYALAANLARNYPRAQAILEKAAIEAIDLSDPGWTSTGDEALAASTAFLESLSVHGVFDGMLPSMLRLPSGLGAVRIGTSVDGAVVGEGLAMPMTYFGWQSPVTGDTRMAAAFVVVSASLLELSPNAAISLIERELRRATIAAIDTDFLATITAGVSPTATGASNGSAFRADLIAALDRMEAAAASRPFVIAPTKLVRTLALMGGDSGKTYPNLNINGGEIDGIPVIPTDVLTTSGSPATYTVYVVDAARIVGWSTEIGLSRATHASVEFDDAPAGASIESGSPQGGIARNLVSLWQTNCVGLRVTRWWHARSLAASAVAAISDFAA